MKIVLSWLREFCPTDLSAEDLAEKLTAVGVKVEEVLRPWAGLDGVVVAKILDVRDHPDSDKLCVARVTTGTGKRNAGAEREVVVGVRNMKPGDLVPFAAPGSHVPLLPEPLEARKLRGVVSDGMLCSPRELAIADVHTGILVFPENTPVGADVKAHLGLDDAVLDIEIEPNRPDLMSVVGVAREAAAITGVPLAVSKPALNEAPEKASSVATVEIRDLERCPNYVARVIEGVSVGESPLVAQARLTAAGMRPISNVVDATNYVLLEIGHPLHPFDMSLLEGSGIVVRTAENGEKLTTLDGVERELTTEDLVIADKVKGVAVAGVMGSAAAEVGESSKDVLLESAYFNPPGVLRTARRLGVSTEASMRFERGSDPEAVSRAADRAAQLIAEWSGGRVLSGVVEAGQVLSRRSLSVRPRRASALIGEGDIAAPEIASRLESVDIVPTNRSDEVVEVEVPGFRVDLEREIDLIEEIARLGPGYAAVQTKLPPVRQTGRLPAEYALRRRIADVLVRTGLREIRSLSFASQADLDLFGDTNAVRIANPLAEDEGRLRTRLTPGLLRALGHNVSRSVRTAALFEVGTVFRAAAGASDEAAPPVEERRKVGIGLTGPPVLGWPVSQPPREFDFFDAKGILETLLAELGIDYWSLGEPPGGPFHPARSANVTIGGAHAGVVGEIHPRIADNFGLTSRASVVVLGIAPLLAAASREVAYSDISRFPPARRDLAFIVSEETPAGEVRHALEEAASGLAADVLLFDVHTGDPIPAGKKSLAFSVDFRVPDRTLTDDEAAAAVDSIRRRLETDFGAELRSG